MNICNTFAGWSQADILLTLTVYQASSRRPCFLLISITHHIMHIWLINHAHTSQIHSTAILCTISDILICLPDQTWTMDILVISVSCTRQSLWHWSWQGKCSMSTVWSALMPRKTWQTKPRTLLGYNPDLYALSEDASLLLSSIMLDQTKLMAIQLGIGNESQRGRPNTPSNLIFSWHYVNMCIFSSSLSILAWYS